MNSRPIPHPTASSYAIACVTAIVAIAGIAAIWGGLSLALRSACGWMALVAAVDAALLLRLAGFPAGRARAAIALVTTALSIALAIHVVGAINIGLGLATLPHEAVWRTAPQLALTWWRLNSGAWEILLALAALPLAWKLGR